MFGWHRGVTGSSAMHPAHGDNGDPGDGGVQATSWLWRKPCPKRTGACHLCLRRHGRQSRHGPHRPHSQARKRLGKQPVALGGAAPGSNGRQRFAPSPWGQWGPGGRWGTSHFVAWRKPCPKRTGVFMQFTVASVAMVPTAPTARRGSAWNSGR